MAVVVAVSVVELAVFVWGHCLGSQVVAASAVAFGAATEQLLTFEISKMDSPNT